MTLKFKNEEEFKEWQQKAMDANPKKASADKTAAPAADVVPAADGTAAPAMAPTTAPVNEPKVKTKEDIIGKVQEALRTSSIKSTDSHAKELMTKIVKEFKNTSSDVIEQMHKDEKNLLKEVLDKIAKLEGKNGEAFEAGIKELVKIGAQLEASAKKKGDVAGEKLGQKIQEQAKQKLFEEKGIGLENRRKGAVLGGDPGTLDTAKNRFSQHMLGENKPTGVKEGFAFNKDSGRYHKLKEDGTMGAFAKTKDAQQGFGERVKSGLKGIGASIKEGASAENLFAKGSLARSVFVPHARERELENEELEKQSKKGEMSDIAKDAKGIIDGETPTKKDKKEKSKSDKSASGTGDPSKPIEQLIVAIEKLIVAMDKKSGKSGKDEEDKKTPGKAEKQKDPTSLDKVDAERKDVGDTADRLKAGVNGEEPKTLQPRDAKGRFAKKDPVAVNVVKTPGPSTSDKQNTGEARQAEESKEKTGDTKGILAAESIDAKDPSSGSMLAGAGAAAEESGAGGGDGGGMGSGLDFGGGNDKKKKGPARARDAKGRFIKAPAAKQPGRIARMLGKGKGLAGKLAGPALAAAGAVKGAAGKVSGKLGGKGLAKIAGKGLLKSGLKKIPGLGLVAGLAFGAGRLMKGDFAGAGMEVASGAASMMPGLGTAASVGIDVALAAKDAKAAGAFGGDESIESDEDFKDMMPKPVTVNGEKLARSDPKSLAAAEATRNMVNGTGANKSGDNIEQTTKAAAPKPPAIIPAAPASAPPMSNAQQKGGIPPMIMERQGVRMNDNSWQRFQDRRAIG